MGKVSVMNNKATGGMATYFENAVSYLKNYVATNSTTYINLFIVDTDLWNKIEAQYKDIGSFNHKLDNHNWGKVKGTNVGASLPTLIKDKFYEGGDLSKCDYQKLSSKLYLGK